MPMSAREMFARMIRCEAEGEGLEGMQAVATVIMNRVHVAYGEYLRLGQGDLRKVLSQMCQFTCYKTSIGGQPNTQNIWSMTPEEIHYQVADWALAGNVHALLGESLWYMNPFRPECPPRFPYNGTGYWHHRVREHCYFNPTSLYAQT
ncbi:cell wall hydrolase [Petroclostridium sp. X23]|uniref:cell wall hydrolase n=1 Tax=Petroclostridium sp. X23 TaxID=3045146 RepID=UPI0024AD3FE1|nr:cell wall hydrolase [Petroclostridium sp. X23]WHH61500.1 cell wall hydrolase [Petroclostridium sp. X23]